MQRSDGTSFNEIINFLDNKGYARTTKSGRIIKMTKQMLTDLFKDPFYYGILVQKGNKVDIRDLYNFQPATTEEIYNKVQQLSYRRIHPYKGIKTAFYPLKMMIICSFCGKNMYIGPSTGRDNRYLNARCGNTLCSRSGKSIRMIKVFEFIYEFLKKGLNFTEKEYNQYYEHLSSLTDQKREEITIEIHSKQAFHKRTEAELKEISLGIIKLNKDSEAWNINESKINELSVDKQNIEKELKNLKEKIDKPNEDKLSLEDFLNLSKNAATIVQSANAIVKDQICRLIFLNLTVDDQKVVSYQAKEPFATLLKQRELLSCGQERT